MQRVFYLQKEGINMAFKSKLGGRYPTTNPRDWIIGDYTELDPVFAGRLAYLAKCKGVKIKLTEGYRSTKRQTELYNMYLQYKRTGKGSIKSAAKPGTSWHEFRLAVDTSTYPIRGMNNAQLAPYGLCKPIRSEGWHIQPIETMELYGNANRVKWTPIEEEEEEMTEEGVRKIVKEMLAGNGDTPSSWAKDAWNEAKKNGITDGTKPKGYITREQAAIMLERAIKR